jgi:hypothetical protein
MTHATAEELHDHAYGFRLSEHVASCPECGRAGELLLAERDVLRDVLEEEETPDVPPELLRRPRPAPRRITPPALAAAALLLAALSWMLLQRDRDRTPAAPVLASQESEIYRFIEELRSPSPVRKKLAQTALTKYGGAALEALMRSKGDPNLIDAIRGETADDRALLARMKQTRITLKAQGTLYTDVIDQLKPHIGEIFVDLKGYELETALITVNLDNATVYEAVEKISAQMKLPFGVQFGRVVLGKRPDPIALAPVRLAARPAEVARLIADLSNDLPARRDEASKNLRRLGFGAEPALWTALDASSPETQSRAAELLRELYGAGTTREPVPPDGEKRPKVTLDCSNVPLPEAIAEILRQAGDFPLVWDSRINLFEETVSFKVQGIVPEGALRLLLQPRNINSISAGDGFLISTHGAVSLPTPSTPVLWVKPALARELEALLADLVSSDSLRQETAQRRFRAIDETSALDALAAASWALDGDALRRCQRLRRSIAAEHRIWFYDIPSGAELQTLTPAQRALLDARCALPANDPLTLEALLKRDGVRCEFRKTDPATYRGLGKEPTRWSLLKLLLRPEGLDFYLDGGTIIIDSAEKVQAAVEK